MHRLRSRARLPAASCPAVLASRAGDAKAAFRSIQPTADGAPHLPEGKKMSVAEGNAVKLRPDIISAH